MKYWKLFLVSLVSLFIGINCINAEIENPKTVFDENVLIDYDIIGSSIVGGYNVTVTNKIDGAALILGNTINLNSYVEYALISGQDITINGKIKDALIAGNNIILNESSNIERDIIIYGNNIEISGLINRDVTIYGSNVKIDSVQIAGDVKITANNINITENSVIMGKLSYNDDANFTRSETASIGKIETFTSDVNKEPSITNVILDHLTKLIALLVVFVVLLFVSPKLFNNIESNRKELIKNMGYGIITLLLTPIIILILLFSVFGLPFSLILLAIYLICIYISTIITGYLLGSTIWKKYIKFNKTPYLQGILGITILFIISSLPYIGTAIYFISLIISMGIITSLIMKRKK